jgi:hypothetical protein
MSYKKCECEHNPKFSEVGYYVMDWNKKTSIYQYMLVFLLTTNMLSCHF